MRTIAHSFNRSSTLKRLFDTVVASIALVVSAPIMAAITVTIRRQMGSPVLFRQSRPGRHGQPFVLLKFRSMADRRDAEGQLLPDSARITPFGAFLRKTSLDELPSLLNVVRGEMSLVGPRPLLHRYMPYYTPAERLRFTVRPGVTGWAQVNGRNLSTWDERLSNDIWYVRHRTLLLDLQILGRTVQQTIKRQGVILSPKDAMPDLDVERS